MEIALGMSVADANNEGYRGTNQGAQMKTTFGWSDGGNVGLNMGDSVSFRSSNDETLLGEIIGIMESAVGCQIIVRYEFQGEFKTSTLSPGSLTKL